LAFCSPPQISKEIHRIYDAFTTLPAALIRKVSHGIQKRLDALQAKLNDTEDDDHSSVSDDDDDVSGGFGGVHALRDVAF
jgi:hypothetical protein